MLHRAFNGPAKSAKDSVRAAKDSVRAAKDSDKAASSGKGAPAKAPVDELSPRRRSRSSSDDAEEESADLYQTSELPFPPHRKRSDSRPAVV